MTPSCLRPLIPPGECPGLPPRLCLAVAQLLSEKRCALGLTQYALARQARISREMIRKVEAGLAHPTLPLLYWWCMSLDVDLPTLLASAAQRVSSATPPVRQL
jgi:transcriptional regulator with XRE-family HTH domain